MTLPMLELGWIAGFLEGEGDFTLSRKYSPRVRAPQVQRAPLERLQQLIGGAIKLTSKRPDGWKPVYRWAIDTSRSVQLMMTIYPLMSPKRQEQIAKALVGWRANPICRSVKRTHCPQGHRLSLDNIYTDIRRGGQLRIRCRKCEIQKALERQRRDPYRSHAKKLSCAQTLPMELQHGQASP